MNPRLLFNTLPFFVLIATISLAQQLGRHFWHRVSTARGRQIAAAVLLLVAAGIIFLAWRGFPIRALNAFSITAVGGAVTTANAQEPMAAMLQRVTLMLLAGLPIGLLLAPKEVKDELPLRPLWQTVLIAALAAAIGYALLLVRDPGETFLQRRSTRAVLAIIWAHC
jgi:hypothetical protein